MENTGKNSLKIRFRLPKGEEFEAEGPLEFIEAQRNYFLKLIDIQPPASGQTPETVLPIHPMTPYTKEGCSVPAPSMASGELYFWERIFKDNGNTLFLRQKTRLDPQDLAILLLAGARTILQKNAFSALDLSKSFRLCGGPSGRLDRFLVNEIQSGRIIAEGSKRGRTYRLSDEGFARAFVLAEKIIKNA